jgi:hypothetical protein
MLQGPSSPGLPQDAVDFQNLLNQLRGKSVDAVRSGATKLATPTGTRIAGLGAPAAFAAGSLMQGDVLGAAGELGGGIAGAGLVGGIAKGLETAGGTRGKLLGAGVRLAGGLIGGGIGSGIAGGLGNMLSGATQAAQDAAGAADRRTMTEGKSPTGLPGTGGTGIGYSAQDMASLQQALEMARRGQVDTAREMLPITNQYLNSQMQRQMQLNQQTGQLTGALNRQAYTAQLAGGAQAQAGDTVRTMMTAPNPYAASAFQYRG